MLKAKFLAMIGAAFVGMGGLLAAPAEAGHRYRYPSHYARHSYVRPGYASCYGPRYVCPPVYRTYPVVRHYYSRPYAHSYRPYYGYGYGYGHGYAYPYRSVGFGYGGRHGHFSFSYVD